MNRFRVTLAPSATRTRVLLTHGPDELMRAVLPPPALVRNIRAAPTLLEALAQWVDAPISAVLSVDAEDAGFCLGLTDEMGCGLHGVFYDVRVVARVRRRVRGRRIHGLGSFADLRLLRPVGVGDER
jgi:hypothetical protein